MSATTEQVRDLLSARITEINEEKQRLERAMEALGTNGNGPSHRPKRQPRARRRGDRAEQALALVSGTPGITASGIAKEMKIKPNYLYRLLGNLETEDRVRKDGRRYYPVG